MKVFVNNQRYSNYTGNPNGFFPQQIPGIKTIYISPATNYPY